MIEIQDIANVCKRTESDQLNGAGITLDRPVSAETTFDDVDQP